MCSPSTLALGGLGLGLAGNAIQWRADAAAQRADNRQHRYRAAQDRQSGRLARIGAGTAIDDARIYAARRRRAAAQLLSEQLAAQSASGFVAGAGSHGRLIDDTRRKAALEEQAILHQGDLSAWRSTVGAEQYDASARYQLQRQVNPEWAALPGLMTGTSDTLMGWRERRKKGWGVKNNQ